ncbi:hypothetical protein BH10ACT1_BH10ACT1_31510 [soil metagenome]
MASGTPPPDDVAVLETELGTGDGARLARYTARARTVTRVLAALVVGTGIVALLLGATASRHTPIALLLVVVLCLPAIVLPLYVVRRTGALAEAASHPRELAEQARDLVGQVRGSAELRTLATRVARRGSGSPGASERGGKLRGALSTAKLASTVVGQAQPDEERHALLVPCAPERLARTWWALGITPWAWLVAAIVLVVSIPALLISLV